MSRLIHKIIHKTIRIYNRFINLFFPGLIGAALYKAWHRNDPQFICPICDFHGPFSGGPAERHEHCPKCGSNQRARLQYLVLHELRKTHDFSKMSALHFAPEAVFRKYFRKIFLHYETADLESRNVDHQADLLSLPFSDHTYDIVYASHVLEHIDDDVKAISEIRRILKPGGIAILPVPIVAAKTIEYTTPLEDGHVRAPGKDYFERYKQQFVQVKVFTSYDFTERYQLFNYEDRSCWPTKEMPLRQAMPGDKHPDFVPVCFC